ncbi:cobalamin B12-binding domain-containing protein [Halosimplex marinum]|uniref:cobalamin B12-binding domain-containing protein n=1 Tax=Halosimplex marinum TaxID=3396620 RepID=UPI003F544D25
MVPEQKSPPIRVLVAKVGLDGHDRGANVVARTFRDAGFEVIYSGLHRTPEEIAQMAVQEDVNVVGISIHSGAEHTHVPKIIDHLKEYDAFDDTLIIVGGIVSDHDHLRDLGVEEIFTPGTPLEETVDFVRENAPRQ